LLQKLLLIVVALAAGKETPSTTRGIEERFLGPCCWRENLAVHRSPEADAMRAELRQLVKSGKTEEEIVAFYVARYGQRILREPEGSPAIWLQTVPLVVTALGLLLVTGYIVHAYRKKPRASPAIGPVLDDVDWL